MTGEKEAPLDRSDDAEAYLAGKAGAGVPLSPEPEPDPEPESVAGAATAAVALLVVIDARLLEASR